MKSVLVDHGIEQHLESRVQQRVVFETGLILGQVGRAVLDSWHSSHRVVPQVCDGQVLCASIIPTPPMPQVAAGIAESWSKPRADWIKAHATQVDRMTCGGMDVLGLYLLAPAKQIKDLEKDECVCYDDRVSVRASADDIKHVTCGLAATDPYSFVCPRLPPARIWTSASP